MYATKSKTLANPNRYGFSIECAEAIAGRTLALYPHKTALGKTLSPAKDRLVITKLSDFRTGKLMWEVRNKLERPSSRRPKQLNSAVRAGDSFHDEIALRNVCNHKVSKCKWKKYVFGNETKESVTLDCHSRSIVT